MHRRHLLAVGSGTVPMLLGGCIQSPRGSDGSPAPETSVSVVSKLDQPDVPVTYRVDVTEPQATADHPAQLRISITNRGDSTRVLGEERAVQFHHVSSTEDDLYLHPATEATSDLPVQPGCWRLTEYVAVPEYYGTISLHADETVRAVSSVFGHPELPEGTCLPDGEFQLRTAGTAGDSEDAVAGGDEGTDFEWGFTLRIGD